MTEYWTPTAAAAPPQYSADGRFWWDGGSWHPVASPPPPPTETWAEEVEDEGWEPGGFPLWLGSLPTPLGALLTHHPGFTGLLHLCLKLVVIISTSVAVVTAIAQNAAFFAAVVVSIIAWLWMWLVHMSWVAPRHYETANAVIAWLTAVLRQYNQGQAAQARYNAQQRQAAVQREILYELRHEHHHHHHRR